jgi:hypothetical protein
MDDEFTLCKRRAIKFFPPEYTQMQVGRTLQNQPTLPPNSEPHVPIMILRRGVGIGTGLRQHLNTVETTIMFFLESLHL